MLWAAARQFVCVAGVDVVAEAAIRVVALLRDDQLARLEDECDGASRCSDRREERGVADEFRRPACDARVRRHLSVSHAVRIEALKLDGQHALRCAVNRKDAANFGLIRSNHIFVMKHDLRRLRATRRSAKRNGKQHRNEHE